MLTTNIKAVGITLTPAIKRYIDGRLAMLAKYVKNDDDSALATVWLSKTSRHHKSGNVFKAEMKVHVAGKDLQAVAVKDDLYTAISEVKDELLTELKKYRTKKHTLAKRGGQKGKDFLKII